MTPGSLAFRYQLGQSYRKVQRPFLRQNISNINVFCKFIDENNDVY